MGFGKSQGLALREIKNLQRRARACLLLHLVSFLMGIYDTISLGKIDKTRP
jgi:hypothetical protein